MLLFNEKVFFESRLMDVMYNIFFNIDCEILNDWRNIIFVILVVFFVIGFVVLVSNDGRYFSVG